MTTIGTGDTQDNRAVGIKVGIEHKLEEVNGDVIAIQPGFYGILVRKDIFQGIRGVIGVGA